MIEVDVLYYSSAQVDPEFSLLVIMCGSLSNCIPNHRHASSRRSGHGFLQQAGSSARLHLAVIVVVVTISLSAAAQQRISLAGEWERWIAGQLYDDVQGPSSYHPIGTVTLARTIEFPMLSSGQRLLLRFEGIAGNGRLRVNGHEVGTLVPYAPHVFDVTTETQPGPNRIEMQLVDWQAPLGLGPAAAWEASGGIIYDAFAEIRSDPYIENAHLSYQLSPTTKKPTARWTSSYALAARNACISPPISPNSKIARHMSNRT